MEKNEFREIMLRFATAMYPEWCHSNFVDGTDWMKEMLQDAARLTEKFLNFCKENNY